RIDDDRFRALRAAVDADIKHTVLNCHRSTASHNAQNLCRQDSQGRQRDLADGAVQFIAQQRWMWQFGGLWLRNSCTPATGYLTWKRQSRSIRTCLDWKRFTGRNLHEALSSSFSRRQGAKKRSRFANLTAAVRSASDTTSRISHSK